jgi:hypothetical protein
MPQHRPSGQEPPHGPSSLPSDASASRDLSASPGSGVISTSRNGSSNASTRVTPHDGPGVARVAPVLSLVEWRDREKQEQIDRLLEMLDDLRKDVVAGRVSTLALAGVSDGEEFCQWEGQHPQVLYVLELAKAELLHGVRFGDEDDDTD